MALVRSISLTMVAATLTAFAWAAQDHQRDSHHPGREASAPGAVPVARGDARAEMAEMDAQMKAMRQMHRKMVDAKTPQERNALMAEHTKMMQDSMRSMSGMPTGGMGGVRGEITSDLVARQQIMEKRMEMMQTVMQMMMDHLPAAAAK